MADKTVPQLFNARVFALREATALVTVKDGNRSVRSWSDYGKEVHAVARALAAEGVGKGDGVAVLSGNRAEYHVVDIATMANGAVAVPIYHSDSPEQVKYVLEHAGAKVVFCEDADQLAKVAAVRDQVSSLKKVITFTDGDADTSYADLVRVGTELDAADPSAYDTASDAVEPDDLACLIYTSGTTGPPKGAMITHHNIVWTANSLRQILALDEVRFISFLPLAHIAERMVSHYSQIMLGGETWFGGGIDTIREDLAECRPTVFFAVPRVFEKFQAAVEARFASLDGVQGALAKRAVEVATRVVEARAAHRSASLVDRLQHAVLDRLVFSKLRTQVGLDRARAIVSGAAPITHETLVAFHAFGLPIAEVYGQTEGCGPTTLNPPDRIKIGTVGTPIPGVDVRIADDGEVLVHGGNVFAGYYNNPEATADTLIDGWLHSGDLGELDEEGYLSITGRKKDLIITAGGKNISPQNIEATLQADPLISQAVVIGDRRKFLSALVTLDAEAIGAWAKDHGKPTDPAELAGDADVVAAVQATMDRMNADLANVERIKKFTILPRDFTQEGGEITPTLKVKRHKVAEHFGEEIEAMYA